MADSTHIPDLVAPPCLTGFQSLLMNYIYYTRAYVVINCEGYYALEFREHSYC